MTATSARVLFSDLRTDRLIDTLPVRDIEWDDYIGKAGSLRGTIAVPDADIGRRCMRLLPVRTAVWMEQAGQIAWGGILWTRNPQNDSRAGASMPIQAATFDTYLDHRRLFDTLEAAEVDQLAIARQLIGYAQASAGGDIGIEMDTTQMSGTLRDRTYSRYDHSRLGELLGQLAAVEDGFEWRIQPWRDTAGIRHKSLRLGYPTITAGSEDVILDYPGRIQSIAWPEDGTSQANAWQSRGSSTNNNQAAESVPLLSPLMTYPDMIDAGWPRLDGSSDYTTVIEQDTIDAHAAADLALARTPRLIPEVTISLAGGYLLPELGSTVRLRLQDGIWYPGGTALRHRLVGYSVRPPARGQQPTAKLYLEEAA